MNLTTMSCAECRDCRLQHDTRDTVLQSRQNAFVDLRNVFTVILVFIVNPSLVDFQSAVNSLIKRIIA